MPNELVARNGLIALNNSFVTGSLTVTNGITGSLLGTSSWAIQALTASSADNFNVRGTLTATTLVVQTITSSINFVTGSTRFGNDPTNNTHQFSGSVTITGSLSLNGGVGTINATASWAARAVSASIAANAVTASRALSANTASFATSAANATSASFATSAANATSASIAANAVTASFALNSQNAFVQGGNSFGVQALLGTNDLQNLALETNGTVRMTISGSNGDVGIGTLNPLARLHVAGGSLRVSNATGIASDSFIGIIDGVSNGFRITSNASNQITYNFHNGSNTAVLSIGNSGTAAFSSNVIWAGGAGTSSGNPRSLAIGYSGGNYGQTGYGISFTTSSGVHNYAINDIVSMWEAFNGIRVYAASAGTVGTPITWTTVLDARRDTFTYMGSNVITAANIASNVGNGTLTMNVSGNGLSGTQTFTANQSGNATFTVNSNATPDNNSSTIVFRDANSSFAANNANLNSLSIGNMLSLASAGGNTTTGNINAVWGLLQPDGC
jgi:hypothetical protein